jgi:putative flavoprotein involved in K+ transport
MGQAVVIGAGQAGLATSYHLTRLGVGHVVLERGRVAETWRSQRWDGFYLNTPNWTLQLPGHEYSGPEPDAFASLAAVIVHLEDYARKAGAPVREGVEVSRLRADGDEYVLETSDGPLRAESVVVAAGAFQRPTPTELTESAPPGLLQLHTSEYRNPEQLPEGGVLVVGAGQSGCQIADELNEAGRRTYLSVGRCPWFPRRYRGREILAWALDAGLLD